MNTESLLRSMAVGAATGGRTFTGLAALVVATPTGGAGQPDATLGRSWVKRAVTAMAALEIAADKLPQAPSRTMPAAFGGRLVVGAATGALVGQRFGGSPDIAAGAVAGTAAAAGTTVLGPRVRAYCAERFGRDWVGAVLEDAVVISLSVLAARPRSSTPTHG